MLRLILQIAVVSMSSTFILAGDAEDVKKQIEDGFAHLNKMKKNLNDYSKDGALEFWSSGGLLQKISSSGSHIQKGVVTISNAFKTLLY